MDWLQLVSVVGIPSLISGLVLLVMTRQLNKRDKAIAERETAAAARAEAAREEAKMAKEKSDAIALGIQAILRDRLLQGYRHYFQKGWADYDDRENLENIWLQYHSLGANGVMDGFREKFLKLPISKNEEMEG